jgi:hypothetical protein
MVVLRGKLDFMPLKCHIMQQQPTDRPVMNELFMVEVVKDQLKIGQGSCLEIYLDGIGLCTAINFEVIGLGMVISFEVIGLCTVINFEVIGLCTVIDFKVIGLCTVIYSNEIGLCMVILSKVIGLCMVINFNEIGLRMEINFLIELYMVAMQYFLVFILIELYMVVMQCFLVFKIYFMKDVLTVECKGMELWVSHQCRHPGKLLEEVAVEKPNYLCCRMVHRLWSLETGFVFVGQS